MFCIHWQLEKRRKRLKMKLEMAKFLQDTIEETALQRKDASREGETVQGFVKFMDKVPKCCLLRIFFHKLCSFCIVNYLVVHAVVICLIMFVFLENIVADCTLT